MSENRIISENNYKTDMFLSHRKDNVMFGIYELTDQGCNVFQNPSEFRIRDWNANTLRRWQYNEEQYAIDLFVLELMRQFNCEQFERAENDERDGFCARFIKERFSSEENLSDREFDKAYKEAAELFLRQYFLERDIAPMIETILCWAMGGQMTLQRCVHDWFCEKRQKSAKNESQQ